MNSDDIIKNIEKAKEKVKSVIVSNVHLLNESGCDGYDKCFQIENLYSRYQMFDNNAEKDKFVIGIKGLIEEGFLHEATKTSKTTGKSIDYLCYNLPL